MSYVRRHTVSVTTATGGGVVGGVETDPGVVPIFLANDRVKIVVAQGGNTLVGSFEVVVA